MLSVERAALRRHHTGGTDQGPRRVERALHGQVRPGGSSAPHRNELVPPHAAGRISTCTDISPYASDARGGRFAIWSTGGETVSGQKVPEGKGRGSSVRPVQGEGNVDLCGSVPGLAPLGSRRPPVGAPNEPATSSYAISSYAICSYAICSYAICSYAICSYGGKQCRSFGHNPPFFRMGRPSHHEPEV